MTMYSKIWKLEITSFVGTLAFGATHCYGALSSPADSYILDGKEYHGRRQMYRVQRVLTKESAAALNELNERFGRDHLMDYQGGEAVHQYDSEEDLKRHALVAWNHVCKDPEAVLLAGSVAVLGPAEPLGGPQKVLDVLRPIWEYDESETSYNWTDIREEASRQWDEAIERLKLDERPPLPNTIGGGHPEQPPTLVLNVSEVDGGFVVEQGEW